VFDEMLRGPDCILWKGGRSMGYGIIAIPGGQPMRVHRFVYLAFVGSIPKGRNVHVHHKCHTKLCINLDHLELIGAGAHANLHRKPRATCTVCGKPANARGLCSTHYLRWKRHGDPLLVLIGGWGHPRTLGRRP
jgi:hypothetical protein